MRVCLISSGSGSRGGGEIYLHFLADGLKKLGIEVHALVPGKGRMDELAHKLSGSSTVHRIDVSTTYERNLRNAGAVLDRKQIKKVTNFIRKIGPDLVHVNQQVSEDGLDLLLAAQESRLPYVSTIHVTRSAKALGARLGFLRDAISLRILNRLSPSIIVVSDANKRQMASRFASNNSTPSLSVVHNGIKIYPKMQVSRSRTEARRSWKVSDDDLVIGTVGRIEDQKDPIAFIDYARPFANGDKSVNLVWIGDGTMRGQLESYAASTSTPLTIDGWREDAASRIAGFDLFMLPSRYEGLPLALLEAMAAETTIIASNTDGIPEAIRSGENGLLCGSRGDWNSRLNQVVASKDLRNQLRQAARADAEMNFSLDIMAEKTLGVYRNAIAGSQSASGTL